MVLPVYRYMRIVLNIRCTLVYKIYFMREYVVLQVYYTCTDSMRYTYTLVHERAN